MTVEVLKPAFARDTAHQTRGGPRLPVRMTIAGRSHVVSHLTEDGSALVEFDGKAEPGQILQTTLIVELDGFDISMPALWEVTSRVADQAKLELQLAATNSPTQLARINSVIGAVLNGHLVGSTDVLDIAGKRNLNEPEIGRRPARAQRTRYAIRRRLGAIFFLLLAAVLLAFIGANIAARSTMVQASGTVVNPQAVLSRAPADGELVSFVVPEGTRVRPGSPVALVKTPAGVVSVASPCDCVVASEIAVGRTVVRQGDPLAQLVPVDGTSKALVSVPRDSLRRIRVGDTVTATFYDTDDKVTGTVERVSPPKVVAGSAGQDAGPNGIVEVRFARNLPAWRVGEPIKARILLSWMNPFA